MALFMSIMLLGMSQVSFAEPFVAGDKDTMTPQIRIVKPNRFVKVGKPLTVQVEVSPEFNFCGECATDPVTEYLAQGQVDGQGHVHVYLQPDLRQGFSEDRTDGVFCAFNQLNPTTKEIAPGIWQSECPAITERGRYRMCATVETNAHGQRMKAGPRDFPPVDCQAVRAVGWNRK